jgi:hypothetical protein
MVQDHGRVELDAVEVALDDRRAVSDAGSRGSWAANAGHKVMTLLYAMALGADYIEDCDVLRAGPLSALLARVAAPSTLGTFLRACTFGHVRQLDRLLAETLRRAPIRRQSPTRSLSWVPPCGSWGTPDRPKGTTCT